MYTTQNVITGAQIPHPNTYCLSCHVIPSPKEKPMWDQQVLLEYSSIYLLALNISVCLIIKKLLNKHLVHDVFHSMNSFIDIILTFICQGSLIQC